MSLARNLVRSTSWIFISDIIGNVISFLLIILIARSLGDDGLGVYSYAIAFVSLSYFVLDTGAIYYVAREMSRDLTKARIYNRNLLTLRVFFCFIAFLVPTIAVFLMESKLEIRLTVFFAGIAMFFNYFGWSLRPVFQAHEGKLKFEAISRIIERVVAFSVGAYFLVVLKLGVAYIMVALIVSYLTFYIVRVFFSKKIIPIEFGFDKSVIKEIFIKSIPFWFTIIFIKLYFTMDTLMLSWLTHNYSSVGLYNASYKILDGLKFIPAVIGVVVFPVMSRLFVEDRDRLQNLLNFIFKYLFMIVLPLMIGVFLLADKIILFLYTEEFISSILVLQILIVAGSLGFISYLFGNFLQSANKQFYYAAIVGFGTLINLGLNLFLIPLYSYIGASIATIFTEIICFVLFYFIIVRMNFRLHLVRLSLPIILAGGVMGVCLYYLRSQHLFVLIPLGIVVYFIVLFLVGGIRKEEFNLLKEAVSKERPKVKTKVKTK